MNRLAILFMIALTAADVPEIIYPAGRYEVVTTGPTKVTSGDGWVRIEWSAEPGPPVKPPDPAPPPPTTAEPPVVVNPPAPPAPGPTGPSAPLPGTGPIWIAAVYEKAKLTSYPAGQQALLTSGTIGPALLQPPLLATWSAWDQGSEKLGPWLTDAAKQGLPAPPFLIVISSGGNVVMPYRFPADEAGMIELAKKLRGAN